MDSQGVLHLRRAYLREGGKGKEWGGGEEEEYTYGWLVGTKLASFTAGMIHSSAGRRTTLPLPLSFLIPSLKDYATLGS